MVRPANGSASGFEQVFKNRDDVPWKEAGRTTELDYTEQSSWMLSLKSLTPLYEIFDFFPANEPTGRRACSNAPISFFGRLSQSSPRMK